MITAHPTEVRRQTVLDHVDAVAHLLARGGVHRHDFPRLLQADPTAAMRELPVSREVLAAEGLGPAFLEYMANWKGFVGA